MARASKSLALYAIATALVSGSNFLSAPLLIRLLGVQGFTDWSVIEPVMLTTIPLAGLGIQFGLLNELRKEAAIAGSLFPWHAVFSFIIASTLTLAMLMLGWSLSISILTGAAVLAEGVITFLVSFWRARNKPLMYAALEGLRAFTVASILGLLVLLVTQTLTVEMYLVVRLVIGSSFLALGIFAARFRFKPNWGVAKKAIVYGLPIVLASATVAAFLNFDRYFVLLHSGNAPLASYVGHVKLVQILGAALSPFFIWFAPIAVRQIGEGSTKDGVFGQSFYGFVVVNAALSVGLWLSAPVIWNVMFPQIEFSPSLLLVNIIGMAVFSCGNPLSVGTLKEGNTGVAFVVTSIACVTGFIIMWVAGSIYGPEGVALGKMAAMFTYPLLFALHTWISLSVTYPWRNVAIVALFSVVLAAVVGSLTGGINEIVALIVGTLCAFLVLGFGYTLWKFSAKGEKPSDAHSSAHL